MQETQAQKSLPISAQWMCYNLPFPSRRHLHSQLEQSRAELARLQRDLAQRSEQARIDADLPQTRRTWILSLIFGVKIFGMKI